MPKVPRDQFTAALVARPSEKTGGEDRGRKGPEATLKDGSLRTSSSEYEAGGFCSRPQQRGVVN